MKLLLCKRALSILVLLALLLSVVPLPAAAGPDTPQVCSGMFFSEYIEGSSNNKALEIFNGTGAAIDLTAGGYKVQMYFNGSGTAGLTINLVGTVADGDVFVLAQSSASATILAQADQTNGSGWYNGDDTIVLSWGTTIIDVIGQSGFDPGSEWGTGLTSTADNTLRRKASVSAGDTNGADAFDPAVEWDGYANDTFDGLGAHSATCYSSDDVPPTVASTIPANGATSVALDSNITVTFSEPVMIDNIDSFFDIFCEVSGVPTQQYGAGSGGPTTFTINPTNDLPNDSPDGSECVVTIKAAQVVDQDGTLDNMAADHVFSFTTVAPPTMAKIHDIQGSGSAVNPGTYTVEAIVTGDYQGATGTDDFKLDGFFIQEEDADADANAATSEGIFVYCATCPTNVVVGDKVQVTGAAGEFFDMSQLSATTAGSVVVVSSGNALPTPAALTLPAPGVTATDLAGATAQINAYYEPFEGMLVKFPAQLSVTEYFELSRYGQLVLSQGGRFRQFTDSSAPSAAGYTAHLIDKASRTVILDDDSNQQNHALFEGVPVFHPTPGFSISNYLRGGDTITDLTGVLHWSFAGQTGTDAWRIRPVMNASNAPVYPYTFISGNPRGAAAGVGGNLKVASFNVLNYFTTLNERGAHSTAELNRQADKIVAAFAGLDADVIGVMEIENNNDGAIADLVDRLNASAGAGTYAFVSTGTVGTDQITVGIIYKPARVTPVGAVQMLTAAAFTDPNATGTQRNRPAVAQTFEENIWGERFTVVVNHLKSKGSCPSSGPDTDQSDGQGCWNDTRQKGAAYLVNTWIPTLAASSGDPDFLIVGDLNAYRNETPISNIEAAGYTDLLDTLLDAAAYGYVFDGQLGYLDHALSSATLTPQVTGVTEWHINSDEVNLLDYNDTIKDTDEQDFDAKPAALPLYEANAYRSSDHDPVLVGLGLYPDLSDLASTYGLAWHTGQGVLRLGALWSGEELGSAGGDDVSDDGVTFGAFTAGQTSTVSVDVQGAPSNDRWLRLWFDWDSNGVFDEAERVYNGAVVNGVNSISVPVPAGLTSVVNFRARLYDSTGEPATRAPDAGATGGAFGGEVEDGASPSPLAVTLASFSATQQGNALLVSWETVSELDNAGFNLYRSDSAAGPLILLAHVPSQAPGSAQGFAYSYGDFDVQPGQTYWYTLEDISLGGATTLHGPVNALVSAPTAVTLSSINASPAAGVALPWLWVAVSAGMALGLSRLRRHG